jgi:hypothetical protein
MLTSCKQQKLAYWSAAGARRPRPPPSVPIPRPLCCAARPFSSSKKSAPWPVSPASASSSRLIEAALNKRNGTGNVHRFSWVDYELAVPVTYTVGKLALSAGWRYVVPVNLPADDTESRALSVWTAGLTLTL